MEFQTETLQRILTKALKCSSFNRYIPLSSLVNVNIKPGSVKVTTTNGNEWLVVSECVDTDETIEFTVDAYVFFKLVSKITTPYIEISLFKNGLNVSGNGDYRVELPLDSEGNPISVETPIDSMFFDDKTYRCDKEWRLADIKNIISYCKPALDTLDSYCYNNYYVHNAVVATNRKKIAFADISLFDDPVLINPTAMDLLSVMETDKIVVYRNGDSILFDGLNCRLYTKCAAGVEDFAIVAINSLLQSTLNNRVCIRRQYLLDAFDRLRLFTTSKNSNSVFMKFDEDSVRIYTDQAFELVKYEDDYNTNKFDCNIDLDLLEPIVKAQTDDVITIEYGANNAIKILNDVSVSVVALENME